MSLGQSTHQPGVFQGRSAQDDPIHAAGEKVFGPLPGAHAAPQLHRDGQGRGDGFDGGVVAGLPPAGAVQVHQVEPLGAKLLPFAGHGHGIVAKTGHLAVVPLAQPHTGAIQQVNGGNHLHGNSSKQHPVSLITRQG